jgi:hypothetical protein
MPAAGDVRGRRCPQQLAQSLGVVVRLRSAPSREGTWLALFVFIGFERVAALKSDQIEIEIF